MSAAGRADRRWGWHALSDEWAARLVVAAQVQPGDLVVDLGAGRGAITRHLAAAGARVVAVELHPGRATYLREVFRNADVTVVCADLGEFRFPHRSFRVVANPPFATSSALLRRLLAPGTRLVAADLILQRAVVRRYASGEGPGAGRWLRQYDVDIGLALPRSAFQPRPQVDSSVLRLRRRRAARR